ncbi:restriction endonuclease subunit S [Streptomyces litmocidini]|uniref:restriction endonuclease subunit S n=1 Tax=Streptomyces litmocidini TaxID=67318 RepID=UPI0036F7FDA0
MIPPFPVPENWQWVSFGSIASVVSNLVDPSRFPDSIHVAPNNIEAGTGNLLPCAKVSEDGVESPKHSFSAGQILYSKIRPYLAKVVIPEFSGLCSADIYPIETSIDSRYLWRWMLSEDFTKAVSKHEGRGVLPKINKSALATLPVPLPPRAEQRRIAAVLDQVDSLRVKRRDAILLLDDLVRSIFIEMFGDSRSWPVVDLKSVASLITKGTTPTSVGLRFTDSGVQFLRVQNIAHGGVDLSTGVLYIDEESHRVLGRSRVLPGDVLVSIAGTIGRSGLVPPGAAEMNCNQAVAIVRLLESVDRRYVLEWLNSPEARQQIAASSVTGTISNLSLGQLGGLKLPLPPLERQQEFARRLSSVDRMRAAHGTHLATLDELFTSLQHRAFSGTLWDYEASGEAA